MSADSMSVLRNVYRAALAYQHHLVCEFDTRNPCWADRPGSSYET